MTPIEKKALLDQFMFVFWPIFSAVMWAVGWCMGRAERTNKNSEPSAASEGESNDGR